MRLGQEMARASRLRLTALLSVVALALVASVLDWDAASAHDTGDHVKEGGSHAALKPAATESALWVNGTHRCRQPKQGSRR